MAHEKLHPLVGHLVRVRRHMVSVIVWSENMIGGRIVEKLSGGDLVLIVDRKSKNVYKILTPSGIVGILEGWALEDRGVDEDG